jgi:hypothetical protein
MKYFYKLSPHGGLYTDKPAHEIPLNCTPDCTAVWTRYGRIERVFGKEKNADTQLDGTAILRHAIFIDSSQNEYNLAITNTKAYKKDGSDYTSIQGSTDFTSTVDSMSCVSHYDSTGSEIAVISNIVDGMKKWTGAGNIADLDGSPPKAKVLLPFKGYLLALDVVESGDRDRRKIRHSALYNGESWSSSNYIYLKTSTDPIITGSRMRDRAIIYKERSISLLDYIGGSLLFDLIENYINGIGPASIDSVCEWGQDGERHFILAQDTKIYTFDGIDHFHISQNIDSVLQNINPTYKNLISSVAIPDLNKIMWAVPLGSDQTCKTLIIYDVLERSFWVKYNEPIAINSFGKSKLEDTVTWDTLPFTSWDEWSWDSWDTRNVVANSASTLVGCADGYVRRLTEGLDDDGEAIASYYQQAFNNIDGSDETLKQVSKIYIEVKNVGSGSVTVTVYTDNNFDVARVQNEDGDAYQTVDLYDDDDPSKAYIVAELDVSILCYNIAVEISRSDGTWSGKIRGFDYEIIGERLI